MTTEIKHITRTGELYGGVSVEYKITNPDRGIWNVYVASEYEALSSGVDFFDADQYAALKSKLAGILVATFKTRKAAREYVTSIGGTY